MPILPLVSLVLVGAMLSAFGGILLKLGAVKLSPIHSVADVIAIFLNWQILAGLAMYFIPAVMWIILLRRVDLSLLQPLMSIVYVITPILAIYYFGEHVSPLRWSGIAVIIAGVCIVARS